MEGRRHGGCCWEQQWGCSLHCTAGFPWQTQCCSEHSSSTCNIRRGYCTLQAPVLSVALSWALPSSSLPALNWAAQHWAQCSGCGLPRAEQKGREPPSPCWPRSVRCTPEPPWPPGLSSSIELVITGQTGTDLRFGPTPPGPVCGQGTSESKPGPVRAKPRPAHSTPRRRHGYLYWERRGEHGARLRHPREQ